MGRPKKIVTNNEKDNTTNEQKTLEPKLQKTDEKININGKEFEVYKYVKEIETDGGKQLKELKAIKIL
jgi:hypothetical protein